MAFAVTSRDARRRLVSRLVELACGGAVVVALIPLALVLWYVLRAGLPALDAAFFTRMPKPVGETGGGTDFDQTLLAEHKMYSLFMRVVALDKNGGCIGDPGPGLAFTYGVPAVVAKRQHRIRGRARIGLSVGGANAGLDRCIAGDRFDARHGYHGTASIYLSDCRYRS